MLLLAALAVFSPQTALAHRSGCHTLHTCEPDTNNYVCGDLGYPCNGAMRIEDIDPATIFVPLLTEKVFMEVFARIPTPAESEYWKKRFRTDKNSIFKLRPAMAWHKSKASFGPTTTTPKAVILKKDITNDLNTLFASVYDGRAPTASEHAYWLSRLKDKPTAPAIVGAMAFHKEHDIKH